MSYNFCRLSLVIAALALAVGCDKKDEPKVTGGAGTNSPTVDQMKSAASDAADKAKAEASKLTEDAKAKLDEAMQYIKENKIDAADKVVTELEKVKSSLPEALQTQLANARKAIDAAKAGAAKMPGM